MAGNYDISIEQGATLVLAKALGEQLVVDRSALTAIRGEHGQQGGLVAARDRPTIHPSLPKASPLDVEPEPFALDEFSLNKLHWQSLKIQQCLFSESIDTFVLKVAGSSFRIS